MFIGWREPYLPSLSTFLGRQGMPVRYIDLS